MNFYTEKETIVIEKILLTEQQFITNMLENKPSEIYNYLYSMKVPCWYITEYLGNGNIKYYANSWSDKTPKEDTLSNVYKNWKYQGLINCHF